MVCTSLPVTSAFIEGELSEKTKIAGDFLEHANGTLTRISDDSFESGMADEADSRVRRLTFSWSLPLDN